MLSSITDRYRGLERSIWLNLTTPPMSQSKLRRDTNEPVNVKARWQYRRNETYHVFLTTLRTLYPRIYRRKTRCRGEGIFNGELRPIDERTLASSCFSRENSVSLSHSVNTRKRSRSRQETFTKQRRRKAWLTPWVCFNKLSFSPSSSLPLARPSFPFTRRNITAHFIRRQIFVEYSLDERKHLFIVRYGYQMCRVRVYACASDIYRNNDGEMWAHIVSVTSFRKRACIVCNSNLDPKGNVIPNESRVRSCWMARFVPLIRRYTLNFLTGFLSRKRAACANSRAHSRTSRNFSILLKLFYFRAARAHVTLVKWFPYYTQVIPVTFS